MLCYQWHLSLPNRAMDPLLLSFALVFPLSNVYRMAAESGAAPWPSIRHRPLEQEKPLKDMIERYREAQQFSKELSPMLEFVLPQMGPATSSSQYWQRIVSEMRRGCKKPKSERTVWWLCSIGTFSLESQIFWEPCFWERLPGESRATTCCCLGFLFLAPWLHESRQTIEIVCCNACHCAWSHRIAFSPFCWRLSVIAHAVIAVFWQTFR